MIRPADILHYSINVLLRHRFRSAMVLLAMSIGVASVIILTALGEGARRYVLDQFSFLGTDVIVMFPGKKETTGGLPPMMGAAARDITIDNVQKLAERVPSIAHIAPLLVGTAEVSHRHRTREVLIIGSNAALLQVRQLNLAQGKNLANSNLYSASEECIIGQTLHSELLGNGNALGQWLRLSDYRCRIVGVLEGRGDAMGMNLSDTVIISAVSAQRLFNANGLFRVLIKLKPGYDIERAKIKIAAVMKELHQNEEDVTLISPDAMLSTFNGILLAMTLAVTGVAAISLLVAGVLIMNITLISVSQRKREIGLLKALGAKSSNVLQLILSEALLIVFSGIALGVVFGSSVVVLLSAKYPSVPFHTPWWSYCSVIIVSTSCGLLFAWLPARRASQMQPLDALQNR
jgi:putative ABC transport system permease protein